MSIFPDQFTLFSPFSFSSFCYCNVFTFHARLLNSCLMLVRLIFRSTTYIHSQMTSLISSHQCSKCVSLITGSPLYLVLWVAWLFGLFYLSPNILHSFSSSDSSLRIFLSFLLHQTTFAEYLTSQTFVDPLSNSIFLKTFSQNFLCSHPT